MNTKFIASSLIAVAALASSAAFAGQDPSSLPVPLTNQFSRAQVQADYFQAVKTGALPVVAEAGYTTVTSTATALSRDAVRAQAVQWAHVTNKPVGELM